MCFCVFVGLKVTRKGVYFIFIFSYYYFLLKIEVGVCVVCDQEQKREGDGGAGDSYVWLGLSQMIRVCMVFGSGWIG